MLSPDPSHPTGGEGQLDPKCSQLSLIKLSTPAFAMLTTLTLFHPFCLAQRPCVMALMLSRSLLLGEGVGTCFLECKLNIHLPSPTPPGWSLLPQTQQLSVVCFLPEFPSRESPQSKNLWVQYRPNHRIFLSNWLCSFIMARLLFRF